MIGILLITHGEMGAELMRCAESIVGKQQASWVLALNPEEGPHSLEEKLKKILAEMNSFAGILVLVDMLGGTPCNVSLKQYRDLKVPYDIVTGVNLPMLISVLTSRHYMPIDQLAQKLVDDSHRNIIRPIQKLKDSESL